MNAFGLQFIVCCSMACFCFVLWPECFVDNYVCSFVMYCVMLSGVFACAFVWLYVLAIKCVCVAYVKFIV